MYDASRATLSEVVVARALRQEPSACKSEAGLVSVNSGDCGDLVPHCATLGTGNTIRSFRGRSHDRVGRCESAPSAIREVGCGQQLAEGTSRLAAQVFVANDRDALGEIRS